MRDPISIEKMAELAPAVFGATPHPGMTKKYDMVPTIDVVKALVKEGFQPVDANQTKARKIERASTNRHIVRFQHEELARYKNQLKDSVPEIVLYNSHNGTCCYRLMFGIFRFACSNGLVVASSMFDSVTVRHIHNPIEGVIEASYKLIDEAPAVTKQIVGWRNIKLNLTQQQVYAKHAFDAKPGDFQFDPELLLHHRRAIDAGDEDGTRSLWKTMNVVQENLVQGGLDYDAGEGKFRQTRAVKAVHANELLNRNLWFITESYASQFTE